MIYLHGNKIKKFSDLKRLTQLKELYSLTLHGNPIENAPNYRSSVISMFPDLKSLDFAKVTEDEKDSARLQIIVSKNSLGSKNGERREGREAVHGGHHGGHAGSRASKMRGASQIRQAERELKKYSL